MAAITLEAVKVYCRIDGTEEDGMLQDCIESANMIILERCGKTKKINTDGSTTAIEETKPFQLAVMQLVCYWYDNRVDRANMDATKAQSPLPPSVDMLVDHFKNSDFYS